MHLSINGISGCGITRIISMINGKEYFLSLNVVNGLTVFDITSRDKRSVCFKKILIKMSIEIMLLANIDNRLYNAFGSLCCIRSKRVVFDDVEHVDFALTSIEINAIMIEISERNERVKEIILILLNNIFAFISAFVIFSLNDID